MAMLVFEITDHHIPTDTRSHRAVSDSLAYTGLLPTLRFMQYTCT